MIGSTCLQAMRRQLPDTSACLLRCTQPPSDLAHGVGRDVVGQNDSGDLAAEGFAHAGDNLQAGPTVWQTIVGDDKIGPHWPQRQRQRLLSVRSGDSAV